VRVRQPGEEGGLPPGAAIVNPVPCPFPQVPFYAPHVVTGLPRPSLREEEDARARRTQTWTPTKHPAAWSPRSRPAGEAGVGWGQVVDLAKSISANISPLVSVQVVVVCGGVWWWWCADEGGGLRRRRRISLSRPYSKSYKMCGACVCMCVSSENSKQWCLLCGAALPWVRASPSSARPRTHHRPCCRPPEKGGCGLTEDGSTSPPDD
jgi:hypothetical protein